MAPNEKLLRMRVVLMSLFANKKHVALASAVFAIFGIYSYLTWSKPQIPYFPDVVNFDGTIDYTLIGTILRGRNLDLVGYDKLVIRLPKEIEVKRPFAKGGSGSGAGVSFSYAANPNDAIVLQLNWPALKKVGATFQRDFNLNANSNVGRLTVHLGTRKSVNDLQGLQKSFWNNCVPAESNQDGLVNFVDKPSGNGSCNSSPGYSDYYVLMSQGQPIAFIKCSREIGETCAYNSSYKDRSLMGVFPMPDILECPNAHEIIQEILTKATTLETKISLEK